MKSLAALAVKSEQCPDEICDCAADEIKSTHPPSRRISSPPGDFIIEDDFSHPTGVDLVEKKKAKMSVHSGIREINEIVRHAHDEIRALLG